VTAASAHGKGTSVARKVRRISSAVAAASLTAVMVAALPGAASAHAADAPPPPDVASQTARVHELAQHMADARGGEGGSVGATSTRLHADAVGSYQAADPYGDTWPDSDPRADIGPWAVYYNTNTITLSLKTLAMTDPSTWAGVTGTEWGIDVTGDGVDDFDAFLTAYGADLMTSDLNTQLCPGQVHGSFSASGGYTISFPAACLGGTGPIKVDAFMMVDLDPYGTSGAYASDYAPDLGVDWSPWITPTTPPPPPPPPSRAVSAAGWVVDGWGGLHAFSEGTTAPTATGGPYWVGWDIARGVTASTANGWGAVLDGWGGLHGFRVNGGTVPTFHTTGYWTGWDIARGVAMLPDGTGGFVVDGWGGLHPFATGGNALPFATGGPSWTGWDVARGVAILPDGTGGYVLDAWGGLHPFGINGHAAPAPSVLGPYWPNWAITRGAAVITDGSGGFVLDGWGGLHGFDVGSGTAVPAPPGNAPYWTGWDIARGVTVAN